MENQKNTLKDYSFIKTYKQRALELLEEGDKIDTIEDICMLIDKEDEYVCEHFPNIHIQKGSPFTALFLAVYDWVLDNYQSKDLSMDTFLYSFSYILLDPNNYHIFYPTIDTDSGLNSFTGYEQFLSFRSVKEQRDFDVALHKCKVLVVFNFDDVNFGLGIDTILDTKSQTNCATQSFLDNFKISDLFQFFPMAVKNRQLLGKKGSYIYNFVTSNGDAPTHLQASAIRIFNPSKHKEFPLKEAPNFFQFVIDTEFCNIYMFPTLLAYGLNLFEDYCPYCTDIHFVENMHAESLYEIENNIVFYEYGECPKCGKTKRDAVKDNKWSFKTEGNFNIGVRGGKTFFSVVAALYAAHKHIMFIETGNKQSEYEDFYTRNQTKLIAFEGNNRNIAFGVSNIINNVMESSTWFRKYKEHYNSNNIIHEKENNSFYIPLFTPHKIDMVVSFGKQASYNIRGTTLLFSVLDNVSWWSSEGTTSRFDILESMYQTLKMASMTGYAAAKNKFLGQKHFTNVLPPINIITSSSCNKNDWLLEKIKENSDRTDVLTVSQPSWEVNPLLTEEICRTASESEEDFLRDYFSYANVDSLVSEKNDNNDTEVINLKNCDLETINKMLERIMHENEQIDDYSKVCSTLNELYMLTSYANQIIDNMKKVKEEIEENFKEYKRIKKFSFYTLEEPEQERKVTDCDVMIKHINNYNKDTFMLMVNLGKIPFSVYNISTSEAVRLASKYDITIQQ